MAEIEGLEPELATTFFKKKVFPSIKEYQVGGPNFAVVDETSSDEPLLIDVLMKCIKQYKIPIQQVSSFMSFYCFIYVKGPPSLNTRCFGWIFVTLKPWHMVFTLTI